MVTNRFHQATNELRLLKKCSTVFSLAVNAVPGRSWIRRKSSKQVETIPQVGLVVIPVPSLKITTH